jgi:hypothetical protein
MQKGNILIPSIVGTSAMTLFSYMISEAENENFREPDVLARLVERLHITDSKNSAQVAGWGGHYAIGLLFMAIYYQLWKHKKIKPTLISGALLGLVSGVVGIISWKIMFNMHPNPPAKNLKNYFRHLLFAHVVFGVFCSIAYKLSLERKLA